MSLMNKISIIIPVLNEQKTINETIEKIYASNQVVFEIIVVDCDPKGSTIESVKKSTVIKLLSQRGRAKQMNTGAKKASGKILLFLHSDTELPNDALNKISILFDTKNYVAGAFDLEINDKKPIFRIIEKVASFRSRLTSIPYGDQAIFINSEYFKKIGWFSDIPLMEDVELMQCIKKLKGKIHIFKETVKTSSRRWHKEGIFYCTIRNWFLIGFYYLGVSPEKLVRFYK